MIMMMMLLAVNWKSSSVFCVATTNLSLRDVVRYNFYTLMQIEPGLVDTVIQYTHHYTVSQKKQDSKLLPITSPNVKRFSKFFH